MQIKNISRQFIIFCLIGLLCTAVNYGVFYILLDTIKMNYLLAASIGFLSGVGIGYPLNRRLTFSSTKNGRREKILYIVVYLASLFLSLAFLWLTVDIIGINPFIANILSIGLTTCTNFIGIKWIVFRA